MPRLTITAWEKFPGLVHGFLSRSSPGAEGGPPDWSRELADHGVPSARVVVPRQVHGTRVDLVSADAGDSRPEADGLVTASAGVAVGIVTADCVPVLLVAPGARVAAAVHSGWRGTLGGIAAAAVRAATARGGCPPGALHAAIGPAIGSCCYQVGDEVRTAFEREYGTAFVSEAFRSATPRPFLDLRPLVRRQLEAAGVPSSAIHTVGPCTSCTPAYASARRDGAAAGRQLSYIGWR
jgi:YfiH family protein